MRIWRLGAGVTCALAVIAAGFWGAPAAAAVSVRTGYECTAPGTPAEKISLTTKISAPKTVQPDAPFTMSWDFEWPDDHPLRAPGRLGKGTAYLHGFLGVATPDSTRLVELRSAGDVNSGPIQKDAPISLPPMRSDPLVITGPGEVRISPGDFSIRIDEAGGRRDHWKCRRTGAAEADAAVKVEEAAAPTVTMTETASAVTVTPSAKGQVTITPEGGADTGGGGTEGPSLLPLFVTFGVIVVAALAGLMIRRRTA